MLNVTQEAAFNAQLNEMQRSTLSKIFIFKARTSGESSSLNLKDQSQDTISKLKVKAQAEQSSSKFQLNAQTEGSAQNSSKLNFVQTWSFRLDTFCVLQFKVYKLNFSYSWSLRMDVFFLQWFGVLSAFLWTPLL